MMIDAGPARSAAFRAWLKAFAVIALLFVGSPATAQTSATAMFRGGPQLNGVLDEPPPRSLRGVRFSIPLPAPIRSAPVVHDGVLYVGAADGALYAIDAMTGERLWRFQSGGPVSATPAVVDGMVFFTSRDETLYAVSARDGRRLWSVALGRALGDQDYWEMFTASPTVHDRRVYVGGGGGKMLAIDRRSGRVEWSVDIGSRIRAAAAVTDREVVFGAMDGHLYSLDRATGAIRWRFAVRGANQTFDFRNNDTTSLFASPTIAGDMVVVGARDGDLYGVDLETGTGRWVTTHDGQSWILATSVKDGVVYASSGSANLVQAADLATGAERWRHELEDGVFSTMMIADDVVLFTDWAGFLHALNRGDGRELWRFRLGGRSLSTPTVSGGVVYAASDTGRVYALDVSTVAAPETVAPRLLVYSEDRPAGAPSTYFVGGAAAANLGQFRAAGYEQIDALQLVEAMNLQIADPKQETVIVFSNNLLPSAVTTPVTREALLRRFLDAGGKAVFLGTNPLLYVRDRETGNVTGRDRDRALAILDVAYPPLPRDCCYHIAAVTEEGRRWGREGSFISSNPLAADQVDTVLAADEFGLAVEWVKTYGDRGGAVLQLYLPQEVSVIHPALIAIDALAARQ